MRGLATRAGTLSDALCDLGNAPQLSRSPGQHDARRQQAIVARLLDRLQNELEDLLDTRFYDIGQVLTADLDFLAAKWLDRKDDVGINLLADGSRQTEF